MLEPRFVRFLDLLKRVYVIVPFLNALMEAPSYLKFLRKLLPKKATIEETSVAPIGEEYSAMLQHKSPSKLQDLGGFSIPCSIGEL